MPERGSQTRGAGFPGISPPTTRTVKIAGRSHKVRIEPSYWEALEEIVRREGLNIDELCTELKERLEAQARRNESRASLANALRVFIVGYFRQAAGEPAHGLAGHRRTDPLAGTPFDAAPDREPGA